MVELVCHWRRDPRRHEVQISFEHLALHLELVARNLSLSQFELQLAKFGFCAAKLSHLRAVVHLACLIVLELLLVVLVC